MKYFLTTYNHKRGNTPGGDFTGKVLRAIISPPSLAILSDLLGESGDPWIQYLESLQETYSVCVQRKLPEDGSHHVAFNKFRESFNSVHILSEGRVTETLKELFMHAIHLISYHFLSFLIISYQF